MELLVSRQRKHIPAWEILQACWNMTDVCILFFDHCIPRVSLTFPTLLDRILPAWTKTHPFYLLPFSTLVSLPRESIHSPLPPALQPFLFHWPPSRLCHHFTPQRITTPLRSSPPATQHWNPRVPFKVLRGDPTAKLLMGRLGERGGDIASA